MKGNKKQERESRTNVDTNNLVYVLFFDDFNMFCRARHSALIDATLFTTNLNTLSMGCRVTT